jgi:hypothetical protein
MKGDGGWRPVRTNTQFSHGLLERLVREQYVTAQPTGRLIRVQVPLR